MLAACEPRVYAATARQLSPLAATALFGHTYTRQTDVPGCGNASARFSSTTQPSLPDVDRPTSHRGATVVLVSGGLESASLLAYWSHWDHASDLIPTFVNYGQRNALKEESAARAICRAVGITDPLVLRCDMLAEQFREMQRGERRYARAPLRNLMLLSLAANVAVEVEAGHVALAVSRQQTDGTSDASTAFFHHAEALLRVLDPPLALLAPLARLTLPQVVQLGDKVKAPWGVTWSCLRGGEEHCGVCEGCKARKQALGGV